MTPKILLILGMMATGAFAEDYSLCEYQSTTGNKWYAPCSEEMKAKMEVTELKDRIRALEEKVTKLQNDRPFIVELNGSIYLIIKDTKNETHVIWLK